MNNETLNKAIELKKQIEECNTNLSMLKNWNIHFPAKLCVTTDYGESIAINDLEIIFKLLPFLINKYENVLSRKQTEFDSL